MYLTLSKLSSLIVSNGSSRLLAKTSNLIIKNATKHIFTAATVKSVSQSKTKQSATLLIVQLQQIDKNVWKKSLNRLLYTSKNVLNDKPMPKQFAQKSFDSKLNRNALWYILSGFVIMVGASYAAVPLFKLFCESQVKLI